MRAAPIFLTCLILVGAPAAGHSATGDDPDFGALWTGWSDANRQAMRREVEAQQRVEEDLASAGPERRRVLRDQGRALGERVGEIVRLGDCEEGERLAREAGDFALVEAVRAHCAVGAARRPK